MTDYLTNKTNSANLSSNEANSTVISVPKAKLIEYLRELDAIKRKIKALLT